MKKSVSTIMVFFLLCMTNCKNDKKPDGIRTGKILRQSSFDSLSTPSKETIILVYEDDTITALANDLNRYKKQCKELTGEPYFLQPDIAYATRGSSYQKSTNDTVDYKIEFDSEVGQDNFYVLYSYFLRNTIGIEKYKKERESLLSILSLINSINAELKHGGTYFGHQQYRIHAYAEYAIYTAIDDENLAKEYNINDQKKLFISSLKQLIMDEAEYNFNYSPREKKMRKIELFSKVEQLNQLISNFFYLKKAQEFQYHFY